MLLRDGAKPVVPNQEQTLLLYAFVRADAEGEKNIDIDYPKYLKQLQVSSEIVWILEEEHNLVPYKYSGEWKLYSIFDETFRNVV